MNAVICLNVFSLEDAGNFLRRRLEYLLRQFTLLVSASLLIACGDSRQPQQTEAFSTSSSTSQSSNQTTSLSPRIIEQTNQTENKIWTKTHYEPTDIPMQLKQVSKHVYYVEGPPGAPTDNDGFMSNAAVIIGDKEVVVFDSLGTPSLAYLLLTKIKRLTDKPISKLILSHYHADHIYGAQVYKDIGAEIIAPLGAQTYINSPAAQGRLTERRESLFPWVNDSTRIVIPDRFISKDEVIDIGGVSLKIVSLGSTHSDGDLMVYVNPDHVLLAGDLMFEGRIPFIAGSKPGRWLKYVTELDPMGFNVIIPGHGSASSDPKNAVSFTKNYLNFLHTSMMKAVEQLIPFDEAYADVNWDTYKDIPAFQVNRMNAYFVFLDLEAASVK